MALIPQATCESRRPLRLATHTAIASLFTRAKNVLSVRVEAGGSEWIVSNPQVIHMSDKPANRRCGPPHHLWRLSLDDGALGGILAGAGPAIHSLTGIY
jgi:hypothetical protein